MYYLCIRLQINISVLFCSVLFCSVLFCSVQFEINLVVFFCKSKRCALMSIKHSTVIHAVVKEFSKSFRGLTIPWA